MNNSTKRAFYNDVQKSKKYISMLGLSGGYDDEYMRAYRQLFRKLGGKINSFKEYVRNSRKVQRGGDPENIKPHVDKIQELYNEAEQKFNAANKSHTEDKEKKQSEAEASKATLNATLEEKKEALNRLEDKKKELGDKKKELEAELEKLEPIIAKAKEEKDAAEIAVTNLPASDVDKDKPNYQEYLIIINSMKGAVKSLETALDNELTQHAPPVPPAAP
jgi:chromosome segregation ATPase